VGILTAREFKQIAGRAGRKGFDVQGSVVCQAPEHVIEIKKRTRKGKPLRKTPPRGFVPWNRDVFEKLIRRPPESMISSLRVTHGTIVNILQRGIDQHGAGGGYRDLIDLVNRSHEGPRAKARLRREAAVLFRSLRRAGIVEVERDPETGRSGIRVSDELQSDFSLHQTLSLYLVEALSVLDPEEPDYALDVLSLVESILDDPRAIQIQQLDKLKRELLARLKADGVPYEERVRQLEEVSYPKPNADFIYETFNIFAEKHPWVRTENIHPKSIAREIFEGYYSFEAYVLEYKLTRCEGLLLRYLGQTYNTLVQTVPEPARTQELYDALVFFRSMLKRIDSSLAEEWESLLNPEAVPETGRVDESRPVFDLALHPKLLIAQVRAEMHRLVRALSMRDFEEAALCVRQDPSDPWDATRLEAELAPFFEEYGEIVFTPQARQSQKTLLVPAEERSWGVQQVLLDPQGDGMWCIYAEVDLRTEHNPEGPLVQLRRIGT
jgi:hypothetical protein